MGDAEGLTTQLDRVRELVREVRPIVAARRAELGPLPAALGHFFFEDFRPPLTERALAEFEAAHSVRLPADYRAFLAEIGNGGPGPGYGISELHAPFPKTALTPARPAQPEGVSRLISIAGLGCGMHWYLVVDGLDAGNVWYYDEDGFVPSDPRCGFLGWYEGWLMETLRLGRVAPSPHVSDDTA